MTNFVPLLSAHTRRMLVLAGFGAGFGLATGLSPLACQGQVSAAGGVSAPPATPWVTDRHSAVRLIGGARNGGAALAGIAIRLEPGWKTYWRDPGDSGVPPRFDFSASDNVADVTVLWPAPKSFPDGAGGFSFGYKDQVTFPVRIVAKQPDSPVTLRATIDYAVCAELCVPVEARTELTFPTRSAPDDPALVAALARVPRPAVIDASAAIGIRAVTRRGDDVVVDVAAPPDTHVELFAEGPTPDWALPPPTLHDGAAPGLHRFSFKLEGLPAGAHAAGAVLKLTLTAGERAYDYDVKLD